MSFGTYIDNIYEKTGKTPQDFKHAAEKAGIFSYDMKAMTMVNFLKKNYGLGHGHSMAIVKAFKDEGWVADPKKNNAKSNR